MNVICYLKFLTSQACRCQSDTQECTRSRGLTYTRTGTSFAIAHKTLIVRTAYPKRHYLKFLLFSRRGGGGLIMVSKTRGRGVPNRRDACKSAPFQLTTCITSFWNKSVQPVTVMTDRTNFCRICYNPDERLNEKQPSRARAPFLWRNELDGGRKKSTPFIRAVKRSTGRQWEKVI